MKKILSLFCLFTLIGCAAETPNVIRPYVNGPIYFKQQECVTYQAFPKKIQKWNYEIGMNETYVTYENVNKTLCNYNPYQK